MLFKSMTSHEKPSNVRKIFLIILFAIVVDQAMANILLEAIAPVDSAGYIANIFLVTSIPCALFFASLSDFHCRRNIMIFTLAFLLISGIFLLIFQETNNVWIAYAALACKATGGNVTPIALAALATIISPKKFTISLAIAICAYSVGSWTPIFLRSSKNLTIVVVGLIALCSFIAFKWFKEQKFDGFKFKNNTLHLRSFFNFAFKDLKLICLFCVNRAVILVLLGFICSEIAFYQLLLRGEILVQDYFYSSLALKVGLGYYVGTGILYLLQKKDVQDMYCVKIGLLMAIFSTVALSFVNYFKVDNTFICDIFILSFSSGFALLTPTMFSMLSKVSKLDEQGKIYGLLDAADTIGVIIAVKYIKSSKLMTFDQVVWGSSTILLVSGIFVLSFLYCIKNIRRDDESQHKKTGDDK